jgi:hypothetical protein
MQIYVDIDGAHSRQLTGKLIVFSNEADTIEIERDKVKKKINLQAWHYCVSVRFIFYMKCLLRRVRFHRVQSNTFDIVFIRCMYFIRILAGIHRRQVKHIQAFEIKSKRWPFECSA